MRIFKDGSSLRFTYQEGVPHGTAEHIFLNGVIKKYNFVNGQLA
jgi:hypothetical protein